jgi:hypothetical protein
MYYLQQIRMVYKGLAGWPIPTTPAVDGDMWVQFTEALSFQPEPEIIQNKSASNNGQSGRRLGTVPASKLETRFVFRKS